MRLPLRLQDRKIVKKVREYFYYRLCHVVTYINFTTIFFDSALGICILTAVPVIYLHFQEIENKTNLLHDGER